MCVYEFTISLVGLHAFTAKRWGFAEQDEGDYAYDCEDTAYDPEWDRGVSECELSWGVLCYFHSLRGYFFNPLLI